MRAHRRLLAWARVGGIVGVVAVSCAAGLAAAQPASAGSTSASATTSAATAALPAAPTSQFYPCDMYQTYSPYTVPDNVLSVAILAWGATGEGVPGASGGLGASVSATVPVTPGQTLNVAPGCPGSHLGITSGFSRGGNSGFPKGDESGFGGEGGSSSGVSVSGGDVLVVAGGGGGAGGAGGTRSDGGNGGNGSLAGGNGGRGTGTHHVPGGSGGGAPGGDGAAGSNGSGLVGGAGGGGGGGGYPRGGAGGGGGECVTCGGGGGGGGSSFTAPGASNVHVVGGGADQGDGLVVIAPIVSGFAPPTFSIFKCTGGVASYRVPNNTFSISAAAMGANGGGGLGSDEGPGIGDEVTAGLPAVAGSVLAVRVGCSTSTDSGGWGLAPGGDGGFGVFGSGSGGGGGSGISIGTANSAAPLMVAAGGGGAGAGTASAAGGAGGYGLDSPNGRPGMDGPFGNFGGGNGGAAGIATTSTGDPGGRSSYGGGGGGGGYHGGGGGAGDTSSGGGGGEGTSYFDAARTSGQYIHAGSGLEGAGLVVLVTQADGAPSAPTGVSAAAGNQSASVRFTPPASDGGAPVKAYTVTATATDPAFNQTGSGSSSPITVKNLTAGQTYTFTVNARNAIGTGPASTPSNAVLVDRVPGAPTIQSAITGDGQVTVSFTPSAADNRLGNPITSYTATARVGVHVTTGPGITQTGSSSPITVTGLTNGRNYTVTVKATNPAGTGPQSTGTVITPQVAPSAPTGATAVNATLPGATSGSVTVSWTPPANTGGSPILSYTVTSTPGSIIATANGGQSSATVTGLDINTSYTFTVHATNSVGTSPESAPSNSVTPTPVGTPSPPLNPGAAAQNQEAWVSCLAPFDDGGSAIESYTVTAQPGGITATGTSCPILVQGLTNGVSYTFTVTATNADGGTSQPSQPTSPITPHVASGTTPPANDDFADAQPITGASGSVVGSNIGASVEPGEPTIQDQAGGASVWYAYTPVATGTVQFDTCSTNPGVDGEIEGFIGTSVATLSTWGPGPSSDLCPAGEAGSTIVTQVNAGQTIQIKLDGFNRGNGVNEGPFTLEWATQ